MGEIEWAMWANEQAIVSAIIIMIGGVIGVIKTPTFHFNFWQCAAAAIPIALFIYLFEYPRGKRKKGRTVERKFQSKLAFILDKMRPFSSNYFVRFVLYILLSVPCCFLLPTLMGGVSLQTTAIIYLAAALKGEEWSAVMSAKKPEASMVATSQPPNRPPPRAPVRDAGAQPQTNDGTPNRF